MTDNQPDRLDGLLSRHFRAPQGDDPHAVARIMTKLAGPLPRQKGRLLAGFAGVLLDWQFAPAWPRMAALAGCAAVGFVIGIVGLDRKIDRLDAPFTVANRDLGSIVFEPEPLSGARP